MQKVEFHIKYWSKIRKIIWLWSLVLCCISIAVYPKIFGWVINKPSPFSNTVNTVLSLSSIAILLTGLSMFFVYYLYLNKCSEKTKEIITLIVISVIICIFMVIFLEVLVRILSPQNTLSQITSLSPFIYEQGKYISWKLKPNTSGRIITGEFNALYEINSFGHRDKERNKKKKNNLTRILVLGDSFTVGFSVQQNETYSAVLEQLLTSQNKSVEVWNAGVIAYSPDTEYLVLKNTINEIKPDIVIVSFYSGNDVVDIGMNEWIVGDNNDNIVLPVKIISEVYTVENNQLILKKPDDDKYRQSMTQQYINILLLRFSHLYILLKKSIYGVGTLDLEPIQMMHVQQSEEIQENWQKTKNLLKEMYIISEQNNASFSIVLIPSRMQVYDKEWNYVERRFGKNKLNRQLPQETLNEWCNKQKIQCIDLLPKLTSAYKETDEQLYYNLQDMHFTAYGNKITAEIIADEILTG